MITTEVLSEWPTAQNWGFVFFTACFFITIRLMQKQGLVLALWKSSFQPNGQSSLSSSPINTDFIGKFFLCLQSIFLFSIAIYSPLSNTTDIRNETLAQMSVLIGITVLAILLFIGYKFLLNILVGSVFFPKECVKYWNNSFFSLLSFSGLVLFIPTVSLFYIEKTHSFFIYFILVYFILIALWTFFRIYTIFFQQKSLLLHFILYLCAQEIAPLYLLYRGLAYVFATNQTGILWPL